MDCSTPGFFVLHYLPEFALSLSPRLMSIESVMLSNHVILCCPLLLLPSVFPSSRVFSNESALFIRWPKYWNFSFSISPFNEYSGLISFKNSSHIAGIKIAGRNINNLRYADDTTLMAESEERKSLLMKVKEETEKVGLKLNIQKRS